MTDKRATRDLERDLRRQPDNLPLRLRLAAAYHADGRTGEAVHLYRSVAVAYHGQRRLAQAIAVCRSVLELEPGQRETIALLAELEAMRPHDENGEPLNPTPAHGATAIPAYGDDAPLAPPPPLGTSSLLPGPLQPPTPIASTPSATGLRSQPTQPPPFAPPSPSGTGLRGSATQPPLAAATPRAGVRVLDDEVAMRELVPVSRPAAPAPKAPPVRPVMLPPLSTKAKAPSSPAGAIQAGMRRPLRAAELARISAIGMTPTPLPEPMPYHEAADSHSEITVPPMPPRGSLDDAKTRVAEPRARTDTRRDPEPPERPSTDDAALTRVARDVWEPTTDPHVGASGVPRMPLVPRASSTAVDAAADLETRRIPRIDPHDLELLRAPLPETGAIPLLEDVPTDDEPTNPPEDAAAGAAWPEEATNPQARNDTDELDHHEPEDTRTDDDLRSDASRDGDLRGDDARTDDMPTGVGDAQPSRLFNRPFSETLTRIGPDGSTLEEPGAGLLAVFTALPDHARADLERAMVLRQIGPGEIILREGDRGDSCFVIMTGEVRVLKSDPLGRTDGAAGELIEVARLADGSLFGEFALLADRRRHATVEAVTACELYEIPRRALRELATTYPEVKPGLERFYRERLLATLLATAPLFTALPEDQRATLLARFSPLRADSGDHLVREGERSGGLYLLVLGAVEIVKRGPDGRNLLLATLREGAYFVEMSLLSGQEASASVIAAGPVEVAFLPPREFYDVVAGHPSLWAAMRRLAGSRQLENAKILAGDTAAV
ncbi:MAG: cyclic nucleotide-binding domain-containing protein [Deltaproteobacteria bacterium]|nr:cyclic nucleotide-binding domain-containing protein [Deltaproteobacteria bacterium]